MSRLLERAALNLKERENAQGLSLTGLRNQRWILPVLFLIDLKNQERTLPRMAAESNELPWPQLSWTGVGLGSWQTYGPM
jgi:hypothetical protein